MGVADVMVIAIVFRWQKQIKDCSRATGHMDNNAVILPERVCVCVCVFVCDILTVGNCFYGLVAGTTNTLR